MVRDGWTEQMHALRVIAQYSTVAEVRVYWFIRETDTESKTEHSFHN